MDRTKNIEEIVEGFKFIRQYLRPAAGGFSDTHFSHSQWLALAVIGRGDEVTVRDLLLALGISSSAASQLVNSLEKKQYVKREIHSQDGRVSVLSLTPKAKKTFTTLRRKKSQEFGRLFSALNDAEFKEYLKLHNKLINSIS